MGGGALWVRLVPLLGLSASGVPVGLLFSGGFPSSLDSLWTFVAPSPSLYASERT